MNIQSMEYIIALSKMLNFTKAAAAMNTTQPAFSRVISAAEEEMGVVLFERTRRHVKLTQAGEAMVPQLERAIVSYTDGLRQAKGISKSFLGDIKIGYIPDTMNPDIRILVESFGDENPNVSLTLLETHYYELQNQLMSDELDIVIFTSVKTRFPYELESYPLFDTPLCAIMNERHPLSGCTEISPPDLVDEPFVVLEHDATMSGSWSFVHRFAGEYGFTPWVVCQASMLPSVLLQVSCNKGICIASQFAGHVVPENVKIIPISGNVSCVRYAVWKRDSANPALGSFIECVKRSLPVLNR